MPTISALPDARLVKLFHTGWSDRQIAEEYGISVQAVSKRRVKMGLVRKRIARQVSDSLAERWDILTPARGKAHYSEHSARMLKIYLRLRMGDTALSEQQKTMAKAWVQELIDRDQVLCYDPDLEEGWYYRPRTPQDERRVIDWPADLPYPSEGFKRALDLPE